MRRVKAVRITRRALEEAKAARAWYAERDRDVAKRFEAAIDATVDRVARLPGSGSEWPALPELRRALVEGFPYWVVYEDRSEIVVVAFAHHKRRPLYWLVP